MNYQTTILIAFLLMAICKVQAQPGTEIYLFDLKWQGERLTLSNGKNITNHTGYDNQPFFHPAKPLIYYSSFDDSGRSDIKYYNYVTGETANFTKTHDREYSPTVTPDGQFISCILQRDNGAQDLVQYPINGGRPHVLVWHLKVGYHAWAGPQHLLLFVLDDSIHNSLHNYHLDNNTDTVIAEEIGRSLARIPNQEAMCFVQKVPGKNAVIKRFDLTTGVVSTINKAVEGQDFMTWLNEGLMLMSDGKGIYVCTDKHDAAWEPVLIEGLKQPLKGISRLAVSPDNSKIALVVNE